jgi:tetratricopeptide (TPR) repeat protein
VAALVLAVGLAGLLARPHRRLTLTAGAALVAMLAIVVLVRGSTLLDRSDPKSPLRLRAGNFAAAASMAQDHPLRGVGPGGFAELYPAYRGGGDNEVRHAHSLPLQAVAEHGWPLGLALAGLFLWLFLVPLWREAGSSEAWRHGVAIGLAAFALQNLADFTAFLPSLLWCACLLRGWLADSPATGEAEADVPSWLGLTGRAIAVSAALLAMLAGLSWNARQAGRTAAFAGDLERAASLSERAATLAPWNVDAALQWARVTAGPGALDPLPAGQLALALERSERAVDLSPVRASARILRARLRRAQGDAPGALADLEEAVRRDPSNREYREAREALAERVREHLELRR